MQTLPFFYQLRNTASELVWECNDPIITVEISESNKWSNTETISEAHNMEKKINKNDLLRLSGV